MRSLCALLIGVTGCFVNDVTGTSGDDSSQLTGTGASTQGGSGPSSGGQGGTSSSSAGTGASGTGGDGGAGGAGGEAPCERSGEEDCEDCNEVADDGCTDHVVDDGWHCPNEGDFCWRVSGFELGPTSTLANFGGMGGVDFTETCPSGSGLVGLDATLEPNSSLKGIQLRCASIELREDGALGWSNAANVGSVQGGTGGTDIAPLDCPTDAFVVGFDAFRGAGGNGGVIHGIALQCGRLHPVAAAYVRGEASTLAVYGITTPDAATRVCDTDGIFTGLIGKQGGRLDQFAGICTAATPTHCGDGAQDAGEACDDGNVNPDDGCDFCKSAP